MQDAPIDLKAWKQKVHAVDMAIRTVQTDAAAASRKRPGARFTLKKPKRPSSRVSSPSAL